VELALRTSNPTAKVVSPVLPTLNWSPAEEVVESLKLANLPLVSPMAVVPAVGVTCEKNFMQLEAGDAATAGKLVPA
jgi:hypothetical protein